MYLFEKLGNDTYATNHRQLTETPSLPPMVKTSHVCVHVIHPATTAIIIEAPAYNLI